MTLFPVLVDVYHKEQLVTKEEAEKVASDEWRWEWRWIDVTLAKDVYTTTKITNTLERHGFSDVALHIRGECVFSRLCV